MHNVGLNRNLGRRYMKIRKRSGAKISALALLAMFSLVSQASGQNGTGARSGGPVTTGKVYAFEKIAEGVYYTTSGSLTATGGNHTVIVGDHDVFLVDAGATAAAGRALLEDLKLITD